MMAAPFSSDTHSPQDSDIPITEADLVAAQVILDWLGEHDQRYRFAAYPAHITTQTLARHRRAHEGFPQQMHVHPTRAWGSVAGPAPQTGQFEANGVRVAVQAGDLVATGRDEDGWYIDVNGVRQR